MVAHHRAIFLGLKIIFIADIVASVFKLICGAYYVGMGFKEKNIDDKIPADERSDIAGLEHTLYFLSGSFIIIFAILKLIHGSFSLYMHRLETASKTPRKFKLFSCCGMLAILIYGGNLGITIAAAVLDTRIENAKWRSPVAWTLASIEATIILNMIILRMLIRGVSEDGAS